MIKWTLPLESKMLHLACFSSFDVRSVEMYGPRMSAWHLAGPRRLLRLPRRQKPRVHYWCSCLEANAARFRRIYFSLTSPSLGVPKRLKRFDSFVDITK